MRRRKTEKTFSDILGGRRGRGDLGCAIVVGLGRLAQGVGIEGPALGRKVFREGVPRRKENVRGQASTNRKE